MIAVFNLMEGRWTSNWHGLVELPILVGTSPSPPRHPTQHHTTTQHSTSNKDHICTTQPRVQRQKQRQTASTQLKTLCDKNSEQRRNQLPRGQVCAYYSGAVMLYDLSMVIRVSHFGVIFPNHSASGRDLSASH